MDLFDCARQNNVQELERLLSSGTVNINEKNSGGYTALHVAVFYKNEDSVRILLKYGADVNTYNYNQQSTPLVSALHSNNTNIILMLLEHGCDVKQTYIPLHLAVYYNNSFVVERLLLHGANPNTKDTSGETPLYTAIENNKSNDIIELLLKHGADPDQLPKDMEMSDIIKHFIDEYVAVPIKVQVEE